MKTERASEAPRTTFLMPAAEIDIQIGQLTRSIFQATVTVKSGDHVVARRQIRSYYDVLGDIPAIVVSSLCQWAIWLTQYEQERRAVARGVHLVRHSKFPEWPAPLEPGGVYDARNDYEG